ncbi:MAG: tRNA wybutosine-synthesizing 3 family protein, partial [Nanoarchaeota archaeon]|nr:tRNA wybutosine-synthesizing 3 family protein [Nanoarchaeota archaeon]
MDSFEQRKKDVLSKKDKSSIGKWDEKIVSLCEKINSLENYYTTSSCAGRVVVIKDESKKGPGLFKFVSHDLVNFEDFILKIKKLKGNFKFKQEPPILHVACRNLESAKKLLENGLKIFKRSGIISLGKNFIVELNGTNKIEF